jgi:hypothetical protein
MTGAFVPFNNQLGDQLEAINVTLRTNIPRSVRVKASTTGPHGLFNIHEGDCESSSGCLVKDGKQRIDYWCSGKCDEGPYHLEVDICSYAEHKTGLFDFVRCNDQEPDYLSWVGNLGAGLVGNLHAVKDPDHPAILNLHFAQDFAHP